jgi:hypothetical protein
VAVQVVEVLLVDTEMATNANTTVDKLGVTMVCEAVQAAPVVVAPAPVASRMTAINYAPRMS